MMIIVVNIIIDIIIIVVVYVIAIIIFITYGQYNVHDCPIWCVSKNILLI